MKLQILKVHPHIVNRAKWLGSLANTKEANKQTKTSVKRSLTLHLVITIYHTNEHCFASVLIGQLGGGKQRTIHLWAAEEELHICFASFPLAFL